MSRGIIPGIFTAFHAFYFFEIKPEIIRYRRIIWNKKIRLLWFRLWIRKDEFHKSLNTDREALMVMNSEEREKYVNDLIKRRNIAHRREEKRTDKKYSI
jgi:hypothetical protein